MCETTTLLVVTLLILSASLLSQAVDAPSSLPPLDEDQIQVHWIAKGEPAPFDGILLNDYTYKRLRLKLIERSP